MTPGIYKKFTFWVINEKIKLKKVTQYFRVQQQKIKTLRISNMILTNIHQFLPWCQFQISIRQGFIRTDYNPVFKPIWIVTGSNLVYVAIWLLYRERFRDIFWRSQRRMDILRAILKVLFSKRQSRRYYSQFGEDAVLGEIFGRRKRNGTYVDIGCYHPRKHSNTWLFYRRGWSGLLVDIERAKLIACKLLRPRDTVLLSAVSDRAGRLPFYGPKKYSVLTSLDKRRPDFKKLGEIDCRTLTEILDTHFSADKIDLLSIDVEGHDFQVLKGLDFERYKPAVIVIESWDATDIETIQESPVNRLLDREGYRLAAWTGLSLIYKLQDHSGESNVINRR